VFCGNTFGFDDLRDLVELEGFSSDSLVMCKWISKYSRWFLPRFEMDISYCREDHVAYCNFLLDGF